MNATTNTAALARIAADLLATDADPTFATGIARTVAASVATGDHSHLPAAADLLDAYAEQHEYDCAVGHIVADPLVLATQLRNWATHLRAIAGDPQAANDHQWNGLGLDARDALLNVQRVIDDAAANL